MPEFSEMPIQQMHLSENQQFDYAKFAISIDELEDEWFVRSGTNRDIIKKFFFEVFNNNPNKDFAWVLDTVFGVITNRMSYSEQKQNLLGLGALLSRLVGDSKDNFRPSEYVFKGKPSFSGNKPPLKGIKAGKAVSGAGDIESTATESNPLHLDSPATAWTEVQKPIKDEPIN